MLGYFFIQHINNLYFFYFGLYLDCVKVYLYYNYNLLLTKKNKKIYIFLIKWTREPIHLTRQLVVGWVGLKKFWFAKK